MAVNIKTKTNGLPIYMRKMRNTQPKVSKVKVNYRKRERTEISRNQVEHRGHPYMGLPQLGISLKTGRGGYDYATLGRLFHTRAASDLKDISPYLVEFTLGTSVCVSALKL